MCSTVIFGWQKEPRRARGLTPVRMIKQAPAARTQCQLSPLQAPGGVLSLVRVPLEPCRADRSADHSAASSLFALPLPHTLCRELPAASLSLVIQSSTNPPDEATPTRPFPPNSQSRPTIPSLAAARPLPTTPSSCHHGLRPPVREMAPAAPSLDEMVNSIAGANGLLLLNGQSRANNANNPGNNMDQPSQP